LRQAEGREDANILRSNAPPDVIAGESAGTIEALRCRADLAGHGSDATEGSAAFQQLSDQRTADASPPRAPADLDPLERHVFDRRIVLCDSQGNGPPGSRLTNPDPEVGREGWVFAPGDDMLLGEADALIAAGDKRRDLGGVLRQVCRNGIQSWRAFAGGGLASRKKSSW